MLLDWWDDNGRSAFRSGRPTGSRQLPRRKAQLPPLHPRLEIYDVHSDPLDTPRMLTDEYDIPVWRANYEAFGRAHVSTDPDGSLVTQDPQISFNLRFPGQYYDAESGLHYNRFRTYDPGIGRYISAEPIGQFGLKWLAGVAPKVVDAPTIGPDANLYAYALSDPLNLADPYGDAGVTVEAFAGIGGKGTIGFDANGNFFVSFGLGVGIGAGVSYDPCAQPAGFDKARGEEPTASVSVAVSAGIGAGSFSSGATKEVNRPGFLGDSFS